MLSPGARRGDSTRFACSITEHLGRRNPAGGGIIRTPCLPPATFLPARPAGGSKALNRASGGEKDGETGLR